MFITNILRFGSVMYWLCSLEQEVENLHYELMQILNNLSFNLEERVALLNTPVTCTGIMNSDSDPCLHPFIFFSTLLH